MAVVSSLLLPLTACAANTAATEPEKTEAKAEEPAPEPEPSEPQQVDGTPASDLAPSETQPASSAPAEENILFTSAEWPENDVTATVPKPEFSVPIESVDTSDSDYTHSVTARWTGASQSEVAAYVQSLKDAGFTFDASELSNDTMYSYRARNADLMTSAQTHSSYTDVGINYTKRSQATAAGEGTDAEPEYDYQLSIDVSLNIIP